MNQNEIIKKSISSALGVEIYIVVIAYIMTNGDKIFGSGNNIMGAILMLMIFVLSASVVGGLIIAKPILLYIDGKKKEAVGLFTANVISLFALTVLTGLIYVAVK